MRFDSLRLDHIGIRIINLAVAEAFYAKFGFIRDPDEFAPSVQACGLVHPTGLRIHLIYNGLAAGEGNVLLDFAIIRPGYTHAASTIQSMDALVAWFDREGIRISRARLSWEMAGAMSVSSVIPILMY